MGRCAWKLRDFARKFGARAGDVIYTRLEQGMKYVGPILAAASGGLIMLVIGTYFVEVMPGMWAQYGTWGTHALTLVGLWLAFNIVFNFVNTILLGPGFVDTLTPEQVSRITIDPEAKPGHVHRYCKQCRTVKPLRSHHCAVCQRCVLKMDHHCPWVNSCVGYRNYKHFLLFLVYLHAGSLFFLAMSPGKTWLVMTGRYQAKSLLIPAVVMCVAAAISTFLFVTFTLWLVSINRTSIELYSTFWDKAKLKKTSNPYNMGIRRNFAAFFGLRTSWWSWCLPDRSPPPGDGLVFPLDFLDGDGVMYPYSEEDYAPKGALAL